MRSPLLYAVLIGVAALGALLVVRDRGAAPTRAPAGTVTLVGDSLNLGVERYLPSALKGWTIRANDRVGRTTAEGISEIQARRPPLSSHLVVSLGTNDPPDAVSEFRADVNRVLDLAGPNRCVVWATIWRDGAPNQAFNAVLRDAAGAHPRVRLVEWAEMVSKHPDWLAPDGLHGNETGYQERARAVAEATVSCAPGQTVTG
jgi:lysophospholipase L1-like esterase